MLVPYSTWPSHCSSVAQVIVAELCSIFEEDTFETTGGVVSGGGAPSSDIEKVPPPLLWKKRLPCAVELIGLPEMGEPSLLIL